MNLYTVIMEYEGTTSVSQTTAKNAADALESWSVGLGQPEYYGLAPSSARRLLKCVRENQDIALVNIDGTCNAWCVTFLSGENLALLNIVKTCRS